MSSAHQLQGKYGVFEGSKVSKSCSSDKISITMEMSTDHSWKIINSWRPKYSKKTCLSVTLPTKDKKIKYPLIEPEPPECKIGN